jgi:hypothetical protein
MGPPAEQLIRDYLNRLSVAARGQLGADDRRALVDRTRGFVERKTGLAGPPTAMEVARLLSGLGDPARLVQQERQRLAALRGEMPEPASARSPITRVLRRDSGKPLFASWHWPVLEGNRTDLQQTLLDSDGAAQQSGVQQSASSGAAHGGSAGGNGSNGTARNGIGRDDGPAVAGEPGTRVPAHAGRPDWFFRALGGEPDEAHEDDDLAQEDDELGHDSAASGQTGPPWPKAGTSGVDSSTRESVDAVSDELGDRAARRASTPWHLTMPPDPVFLRQARRALTAVVAWYRRSPLEASAVVLLGLGGAIYPPVWLLGAAVGLVSRHWDGRDKWLGLALPVLATVIVIALGVTSGGHVSMGHAAHEGWVYGVAASRIAALFSASYLGWRSVHGRRPPTVPPWNRPHKIG